MSDRKRRRGSTGCMYSQMISHQTDKARGFRDLAGHLRRHTGDPKRPTESRPRTTLSYSQPRRSGLAFFFSSHRWQVISLTYLPSAGPGQQWPRGSGCPEVSISLLPARGRDGNDELLSGLRRNAMAVSSWRLGLWLST